MKVEKTKSVLVKKKIVKKSWFPGDTYVSNSLSTVEIKIVAGTLMCIALIIVLYLVFKIMNSHQKHSMRAAAQLEIRLSNQA